uniref:Methylated-DNA--protein-cysteine methyltransferase n=1 Tax=Bos taurus TaxID=9913 RepID=A0AAA9S7D3_BOVIN
MREGFQSLQEVLAQPGWRVSEPPGGTGPAHQKGGSTLHVGSNKQCGAIAFQLWCSGYCSSACCHLTWKPAEAAAPAEQLGGSGAVLEPLLQCAAWLDAYFREPAVLEGLPVPALHHPIFQKESFTRQVLWKLLTLVKFGETVSYQQLAALAGNPRAARAVGGAMRSNPIPILIPCHRVVCSSGAMGNYSGGVGVKEWLLAHEGRPAGKAARGGGSRATGSWRGALGSTASSQPAGRD